MKSAVRFLTSMAALCALGAVSTWAEHDSQLAAVAMDKRTKGATQSYAGPMSAQVNAPKEDPSGAQPRRDPVDSHSSDRGLHEPPFLKHRVFFPPGSVEPTSGSRDTLKRAAAWLREHPEARILIVGFCDSLGSETCDHTLAERRGVVVREFLMHFGIELNQIVGVKGWNNVKQDCRASKARCQRCNRNAQIFMASPRASWN
jgi:outer membrane protein OmpA-like peptidoglycan-associated protein